MAYQSINPYDGKVLQSFEEHTDKHVESALTTAAACFKAWRLTPIAQRAAVAARAAAIMRGRIDDFARPVTQEMGKLIEQARGEVKLSADIIDYYAAHAEAFLAPESLSPSEGEAQIESSPIGVLFGVGRTLELSVLPAGAFCGAESGGGQRRDGQARGQCSAMCQRLRGFVAGGGRVGGCLHQPAGLLRSGGSDHRRPARQGRGADGQRRRDAGSIVAARAGKNLKKTTLELGRSDAFIVLEGDRRLPPASLVQKPSTPVASAAQ